MQAHHSRVTFRTIVEVNMRLLTIILTCILYCFRVNAFSPEDETKIDNFLAGVMNCSKIPGVIISLVQNDQSLMTKGYGLANVQSGEKVTSKTKMGIGSLSKAFNSALLASVLSTSDNVTWDTPVREIFGDWFYFHGGYMSNRATLRDLLAHKTGVPRHDLIIMLAAVSREELLRRIRFMAPVEPFRTEFLYNNIMHITAGEVSRVLTKKPYDDALKSRLLDPLGMKNTLIFHKAAPSYDGFAIPYADGPDGNYVEIPFESLKSSGSVSAAAGGVVSDAEDMARWLRFQLNGGRDVNGSEVVDEGFLTRTHQMEQPIADVISPVRPEFPVTDVRDNAALGWMNGFYRGYRTVVHPGSNGYTSLATTLPDMDIGVFSSFNIPRFFEHRLLHAYMIDVTLGVDPWLDVDLACQISGNLSGSASEELETDIPFRWLKSRRSYFKVIRDEEDQREGTRALEDYVGTYGNYAYGNLTISLNSRGTQPFLELSYGTIGRYQLSPNGQEHEFLTVGVGPASIYDIGPLKFQSSDNKTFDELQTRFEPLDPPLFRRDLKMDTAPPPPNNNC